MKQLKQFSLETKGNFLTVLFGCLVVDLLICFFLFQIVVGKIVSNTSTNRTKSWRFLCFWSWLVVISLYFNVFTRWFTSKRWTSSCSGHRFTSSFFNLFLFLNFFSKLLTVVSWSQFLEIKITSTSNWRREGSRNFYLYSFFLCWFICFFFVVVCFQLHLTTTTPSPIKNEWWKKCPSWWEMGPPPAPAPPPPPEDWWKGEVYNGKKFSYKDMPK